MNETALESAVASLRTLCEKKIGGRSTHQEAATRHRQTCFICSASRSSAESPLNSLGGDPSAGSPTDTLFTILPMSPWGVDCIIIRRDAGAWRAVSEGSGHRPAFPADCPHPAIFTARTRYARILGVPRI